MVKRIREQLNPVVDPNMNFVNPLSPALIVDDEKDICYLLNSILRRKQIHAQLAGSLAEAEKVIEKQSPSLIFLDNHLPDGLGLEYIQKLKHANPRARIVMITAHDNASEREKAYQEGADYFISKPFTKDVIYRTLEQFERNKTVE